MTRFLGVLSVVAGIAVADHASAFCGFYVSGADTKLFNNATQVVLMREGNRTVLSMQNNYEGPAANFAMVVPVPVVLQKENVKTLPRELFAKVDALDAPRLVEYWEQDPCEPPRIYKSAMGAGAIPPPAPGAAMKGKTDLGVTVEAKFTVGEYDIVILSAKDAGGLDTWLRQEKYQIPAGSEEYFRPYVTAGSKFFVAKVDVSKVTMGQDGQAMLSPLRFHYDTDQFSLPVRLGLVNSKGEQDLIVHILAKGQRYEVANYPNATIPTNLDVSENARDKFGSFYAALFDKTLEKNPKAVVTEYSWDASTCDPCPGPALTANDLATLGSDVMTTADTGAPKTASSARKGMNLGYMGGGYTITRLHARYTKDALGEDLVFRAAPAILGGRETRTTTSDGTIGELEHGATPTGGTNNFQGRYAIRHPWGGEITCKEPRRGIWGGPPVQAMINGSYPDSAPKPAKDLAFVNRDVPLASFVRSDIGELGIKAAGAPVTAVLPPPVVDAGAPTTTTVSPTDDAGTTSTATKRGCGACAVGSKPASSPPALLVGIAAAIGLLSRRRGRETPKNELESHGNDTGFPQA